MQTNWIKTNSVCYEQLKSCSILTLKHNDRLMQYFLTLKQNDRETYRDVTTIIIVDFCMHDKAAEDI